MKALLRSTAYRVALTYSAAFAFAIMVLGLAFYFAVRTALLAQLDGRIANEILELTSEYKSEGMEGVAEAIRQREQPGLSGELGYAVFDGRGVRIAGQMDTSRPNLGADQIVFIDPVEGPDPARAAVVPLSDDLVLVVAADLEPIEEADATIVSFLFIALGAVVAIGLSGALILGAYLRRRLGAVSATAQDIMAGDLKQRMAVSANDDEFDRLSTALNAMLDRISELMDNLRQVSNDIAHDLRTPLSRLRARLEKALNQDDLADVRSTVEDAVGGMDETLGLFSAILRVSEVESGNRKRAFKTVSLSGLVDELCESYAPALLDDGRSLHWDVSPGIELFGDRELLAQAIVNILENAKKHTPQGTRVFVSLMQAEKDVMLTVADDGPGVSAADRKRISGRFVRLEQARNTPGSGLGLNLVAAIARLHQADLVFGDNDPGLMVSLLFPKKMPTEETGEHA